MDDPTITGFGHIDFTVTDVDRSVRWWEQVMGFKAVHKRESPGFTLANVYHPSGVFVGLITHTNPGRDRFDERHVGLDHLALRVADRTALEAWARHLDNHGIEHSGVQEQTLGPLIVFRDPDNIQLELWAFDPDIVSPEGRQHTV